MPKNLPKQIAKKLEKLHELLDNITESQVIEPDDPDTWDKEMLALLESEAGILNLLSDWETESENEE